MRLYSSGLRGQFAKLLVLSGNLGSNPRGRVKETEKSDSDIPMFYPLIRVVHVTKSLKVLKINCIDASRHGVEGFVGQVVKS